MKNKTFVEYYVDLVYAQYPNSPDRVAGPFETQVEADEHREWLMNRTTNKSDVYWVVKTTTRFLDPLTPKE